MEPVLLLFTYIAVRLSVPLSVIFPYIRDHDCISFEAREEAARVAEDAMNHFETDRCSDSDGFLTRHSSREYGYHEQFSCFRSGPERCYE